MIKNNFNSNADSTKLHLVANWTGNYFILKMTSF